MEVKAKLNYLRIAPRKVRLAADLIRGKSVEEAEAILNFTVKRTARPLLKLLKSASANAKENFHLEKENLYISKIIVNEGPKLKRWRPVSRGSAHPILKRTSNITLVLDEIVKKSKEPQKELKKEKGEKIKKVPKIKKPKLELEEKTPKPEVRKGIKRIFRRKAF